jgi:hypothetical protein
MERRVFVGERVLRDLRMLAIDGLVALRRRGLEVGGILLGETSGGEVHIDAFVEVPCEHRYGPSYTLSEGDLEKLRELLAEPRGETLRVLGFYQSFTSREPVIDEAGEALMRLHFYRGDAVYLMLQPMSVEKCLTSVRLAHDGRVLPESGEVTVVDRDAEPAPAAVVAAVEPAPVETKIPAWAAEPAPRRRSRRWAPIAASLVVGLAGGVVYELSSRTGATPASVPSSVSVEAKTLVPAQTKPVMLPSEPVAHPAPPLHAAVAPLRAALPPAAVHEVQPAVSEGIRARMTEEVVIPVEVEVSERGRVVRATAERQSGDSVRGYLADLAQKTAREWRFTPAKTSEGVAVAGRKTIRFVFAP